MEIIEVNKSSTEKFLKQLPGKFPKSFLYFYVKWIMKTECF